MGKVTNAMVTQYVEKHIGSFHDSRAASLKGLRLDRILKRKNPYLFRARNMNDAHDLVKAVLDAHLSSQEEAIFGDFLEGLAKFVCERAYGGGKSSAEGIDLEFDKDGVHYLVSVKSGPNWGNSRQVKKMRDDFVTAAKVLRTSKSSMNVVAINGCCYGRDAKPQKRGYDKLCGQRFWSFISGNDDMYTDIIVPLGHRAKERNDAFKLEYDRIVNRFTEEFTRDFCCDHLVDWDKLVRFNSSKEAPARKRAAKTGTIKKTARSAKSLVS